QAYDHQNYQLEELLDNISIKRESGRNPLFDVMFDMNNIDLSSEANLKNITLKQIVTTNRVSKIDLTLKAFESDKDIGMIIEYSTSLYKKETIERVSEDIKVLLNEILKNSNQVIRNMNILNHIEKESILELGNEVNNLRNTAFMF
ncbi:condensation domain-containing protein, partial [Niallia taxi]|uniref:condensation domain-containing protein n=3 Tax=Niallia taxi TaxID=2499688 RepID=UPI002E1ED287